MGMFNTDSYFFINDATGANYLFSVRLCRYFGNIQIENVSLCILICKEYTEALCV